MKVAAIHRTVIHPGEHLAEQLVDLGMSATELGRKLKVSTNRINTIRRLPTLSESRTREGRKSHRHACA